MSTPRHPSPESIERVLDREASEPESAAVLAHLRDCPDCAERHGPSFELELWAAALGEGRAGTAAEIEARGPWRRPLLAVAAAALVVAASWFVTASWFVVGGSAPRAGPGSISLPPPFPPGSFRTPICSLHPSSFEIVRGERVVRTQVADSSPSRPLSWIESTYVRGRLVFDRRVLFPTPSLGSSGDPR